MGAEAAALDARQSLERLFHEFQEQPLAFVGGGDAGLGDALDERDHAMMSGISRVRSLAIWSLRNSLRFFSRRSCSWSWAGSPASRSITSSRSWCSISRA